MKLAGFDVGNRLPLFLIAGPCVIESESMIMQVAESLRDLTERLGIHYVFKASFDKANRMLWASTNGQTELFKYDGHGRRTKIQRNDSNVHQVYTRDGRFVLERAPNGTFTRHIHLGNRLLVSVTGSTPTYQHTDHLGSIVRKSNVAGTQTDSTSYAPYGSIQNGTLTQGPGFTGHVSDQASGLSYMQQRYHDPLAMRFVSVDPVLPSTSDGGNFKRGNGARDSPRADAKVFPQFLW